MHGARAHQATAAARLTRTLTLTVTLTLTLTLTLSLPLTLALTLTLTRLPLLLARLHGCVGTVYVHEVCRDGHRGPPVALPPT